MLKIDRYPVPFWYVKIESVSPLNYLAWRLEHRAAMPSTKEDGTALAGELSSMSEPENNEDADTNGTPTKLCSECGKESDKLMKCRDCKCIWYCNAACQKRHWKEHKKECKLIKKGLQKRGGKLDLGTEEDIVPLGKLTPREECPICMRVLPIRAKLQTYHACCGKRVCRSCDYQHEIKSGGGGRRTCAFCRTAVPKSGEEIMVQLRKRVELQDPAALYNLALWYDKGRYGLPVDQTRCIELLRESADLEYPPALGILGVFHKFGQMGLEENLEEAIKYTEKAAEGGDLDARYNLGCAVYANGDHVAAMRHWRQSAPGGLKASMGALIECFEEGSLHHGDLAKSLQAFHRARAEMKSEDRDQYIKHLKGTGKYDESMDS